jgi:hypothetical protein
MSSSAASSMQVNGIDESEADHLLAAVWCVLERHALATPLLDVRSANRFIDITLTFHSPGDCAVVKAALAPSDMQMRSIAHTANQQENRIKRWRQKAEELPTMPTNTVAG